MAVYSIEYDEGNEQDLGYKSVHISYGFNNPEKEKVFNSGNFVKDWFDLMKFIITELRKTEMHFVGSSSVDHFFMDGAKYDKAYLVLFDKNDETVLKYDEKYNDGHLFYVPEGTQPTWAELKKMCK